MAALAQARKNKVEASICQFKSLFFSLNTSILISMQIAVSSFLIIGFEFSNLIICPKFHRFFLLNFLKFHYLRMEHSQYSQCFIIGKSCVISRTLKRVQKVFSLMWNACNFNWYILSSSVKPVSRILFYCQVKRVKLQKYSYIRCTKNVDYF